MLIPTLLSRPAALAARPARAWSVASQQRARRNAMVAATACAERRAQREDVADYLADIDAHRPGHRAAEA
jgi:hypothetical protein